METDKRYFIVGCFVLVTLVAAIMFTLWLVGPRKESDYRLYRIRFAESVSGLGAGGSVKFRGVDVGKVDKISIDAADTRLVRVDVSILRTTPIKADTVASLKLQGITGVIYIELAGGTPDSPDLIGADVTDKDNPPEIPAAQSPINAIVDIMPALLQKVSAIADQTNKLFSNDNVATFNNMLTNWNRISEALQKQTVQLDRLLANSNAVASDIHGLISGSKDDVHALTRSLSDTSEQLNTLAGRTNEAAGGQYQQLSQSLTELKSTLRDIDQLSRSLQENPSQLIVPAQEQGVPAP